MRDKERERGKERERERKREGKRGRKTGMEGWSKRKSERKEGKRNSMRGNYWDFRFFEFNGRKESVLYCILLLLVYFLICFVGKKNFL